jgi:hypothetical protein
MSVYRKMQQVDILRSVGVTEPYETNWWAEACERRWNQPK